MKKFLKFLVSDDMLSLLFFIMFIQMTYDAITGAEIHPYRYVVLMIAFLEHKSNNMKLRLHIEKNND